MEVDNILLFYSFSYSTFPVNDSKETENEKKWKERLLPSLSQKTEE